MRGSHWRVTENKVLPLGHANRAVARKHVRSRARISPIAQRQMLIALCIGYR